ERVNFEYFTGSNPNNAYLQLALEVGIVGAVLFVVPLALGAGLALRVIHHGRSLADVAWALALIASLLTGLVESVFTAPGAPWELLVWLGAATVLNIRTAGRESFPDEFLSTSRPS